MSNIIIAFPKMENAKSIKKILAQSGYQITAVCTTGANALQSVNEIESGIIICGPRFVDMMYSELHSYLPSGFQMLLVAPPQFFEERVVDNLVCVSMPLKIHELLETVEMMEYTLTRRRRKQRQKPKMRSEEEVVLIKKAKSLLMNRNNLTEEEAHRYIQKRSMDNGTGMSETAQMILSLMGE